MLAAELQGIGADGLADVVDVALAGEHRLRDAVAAHGAGRGTVGVNRVGVAVHIGAGIQLWERAHALGADAVAVGRIRALVGEALNLPGGKGAVGTAPS
jgi:hypothetical protein